MILYISMLIGVFLVILGKLNKVFTLEAFSWRIFIRNNAITTLMNLFAGLFLVINQAELVSILTRVFPNNPFFAGGLFAGICGIAGVTIIQYLVDMANPKKKTSFGLNK